MKNQNRIKPVLGATVTQEPYGLCTWADFRQINSAQKSQAKKLDPKVETYDTGMCLIQKSSARVVMVRGVREKN